MKKFFAIPRVLADPTGVLTEDGKPGILASPFTDSKKGVEIPKNLVYQELPILIRNVVAYSLRVQARWRFGEIEQQIGFMRLPKFDGNSIRLVVSRMGRSLDAVRTNETLVTLDAEEGKKVAREREKRRAELRVAKNRRGDDRVQRATDERLPNKTVPSAPATASGSGRRPSRRDATPLVKKHLRRIHKAMRDACATVVALRQSRPSSLR